MEERFFYTWAYADENLNRRTSTVLLSVKVGQGRLKGLNSLR